MAPDCGVKTRFSGEDGLTRREDTGEAGGHPQPPHIPGEVRGGAGPAPAGPPPPPPPKAEGAEVAGRPNAAPGPPRAGHSSPPTCFRGFTNERAFPRCPAYI